jgi:hypothetical protein
VSRASGSRSGSLEPKKAICSDRTGFAVLLPVLR